MQLSVLVHNTPLKCHSLLERKGRGNVTKGRPQRHCAVCFIVVDPGLPTNLHQVSDVEEGYNDNANWVLSR